MPFAARTGFFSVSAEAPAGAIAWYEYDRANYEPISESLTGGTVTTSTFSVSGFSGNNFRYRGGCLGENGNIYCAPRSSGNGILEIDPVNKTSQYRSPGALASLNSTSGNYFHGAVLLPSGNILCVPFNYDRFIEFDPVADTATEFGPTIDSAFCGSSTIKYAGGVLASNGNVWCTPTNATTWLEYDHVNKTVSKSTFGLADMGLSFKFFGSARSFNDDCIYCAPQDYGYVVRIQPEANVATRSKYGQTIPQGGTNQSYGMCADKYGNVVFLQGESGVTSKRVDTEANTAFSFNLGGTSFGACQGADGNVYSITKSYATRKYDVEANTSTTVYATTSPNRMIGITALNGNTYILPDQSSTTCLEIDTSSNILSIDNYANVILTPYMNPGRL
jgi:hypothetical protein